MRCVANDGCMWMWQLVAVVGHLQECSSLADFFANALPPCAPPHVNGHTLLPCSPPYVNVPYHHMLHCTYTNVAASGYT